MTHPTDEELDALVGMLQQRDKSKHGYTGHPLYNRNGPQAAAAITALRAQLAEAWAKLSQRVDMHECAMAERDDATLYGVEQKARADRAEAALAAQIEADAGIADAYPRHGLFPPGITISSKILSQPHDRTALDRMLRAEREKALRDAADELKGQGYNTAVRQILALIEQDGA